MRYLALLSPLWKWRVFTTPARMKAQLILMMKIRWEHHHFREFSPCSRINIIHIYFIGVQNYIWISWFQWIWCSLFCMNKGILTRSSESNEYQIWTRSSPVFPNKNHSRDFKFNREIVHYMYDHSGTQWKLVVFTTQQVYFSCNFWVPKMRNMMNKVFNRGEFSLVSESHYTDFINSHINVYI